MRDFSERQAQLYLIVQRQTVDSLTKSENNNNFGYINSEQWFSI